MLVLDTLIWLLVMNGADDLRPSARRAIEAAAAEGGVLVPVVSVWELAAQESRGRIVLTLPCSHWVDRALAAPGLALAPLTPAIAVDGANLPGPSLADPIDRLIVATARSHNAGLVTRDANILDYGRLGHVRTVAG